MGDMARRPVWERGRTPPLFGATLIVQAALVTRKYHVLSTVVKILCGNAPDAARRGGVGRSPGYR